MLEIIDEGRASREHPHPLIFVHGAWHGGWCWQENFIDYFASRGFRVIAPSLQGHGASPAERSLWKCSIPDFLNDVSSVARNLPKPPVLVGHSMGGFLVQKYLEMHDAPAAVLLASAPPRGHLRTLVRSIRRHPYRSSKFALTGNPAHLYSSTAEAREVFFCGNTADPLVEAVTMRLRPDSQRAILLDMVATNLVSTRKITTPILVLGGHNDAIYAVSDVRRTAKAYNTEPVFFSDMGHELMLEPGWPAVAQTIASWLHDRQL